MSATLVSSNITIKVSAAVVSTATRTTSGTTAVYTTPAGGYAIVELLLAGGGTGGINIGSNTFLATGSSFAGSSYYTIYIGPSTAISLIHTSGTVTLNVTGVEFINSP